MTQNDPESTVTNFWAKVNQNQFCRSKLTKTRYFGQQPVFPVKIDPKPLFPAKINENQFFRPKLTKTSFFGQNRPKPLFSAPADPLLASLVA